tara:strand:+ start:26215 stop:26352 length:138 start_codon:yes stop_codon:yes gene_type:complete
MVLAGIESLGVVACEVFDSVCIGSASGKFSRSGIAAAAKTAVLSK